MPFVRCLISKSFMGNIQASSRIFNMLRVLWEMVVPYLGCLMSKSFTENVRALSKIFNIEEFYGNVCAL